MNILETDRLRLCKLTVEDAPFILKLLNEPSWLQFIGDRGVRTLEDARNYIVNGPMESYARLGFGLYLTRLKKDGTPIGICGLIKRPSLDDVDIGFALLPQHTGQGYGFEAATAVTAHAHNNLGIKRIVAITSLGNGRSINLLKKLGLRFDKIIKLTVDGPESRLFVPKRG